ncbi:MAG: hypothetical protein AVDCRST_MAG93-6502 [uncultured Chloroflexia bacterium]|uniref:Uncharacterized protein n=1 Tax=uncultured Chloroflexia bacterium TaxID=1672391 RepID=A0A6J4LP41_9CHLR|nr:MAG: hypothetical protein AVDCRST_MAG93-6502 [uncultured Chloroflexia bacterium]
MAQYRSGRRALTASASMTVASPAMVLSRPAMQGSASRPKAEQKRSIAASSVEGMAGRRGIGSLLSQGFQVAVQPLHRSSIP